MPDTPDKKPSGFRREGINFSPPPQSAKTQKPAAPAKPREASQRAPDRVSSPKAAPKPAERAGAPKATPKPAERAGTPKATPKPAERVSAPKAAPKPSGKPEPKQGPARRSVLPKGYEPSPSSKPAPAAPFRSERPPAVTPDTAVFRRPDMPKAQPSANSPREKHTLFHVALARRPRAFTGLLAGILYVILVLAAAVVIGTAGWSCVRDVLALQKEPVTTTVELTEDMSITDLAKLLKNEGIIEYEWLFRLYCDISDAEEKISPGTYNIEAKDYRALVNMMTPYSDSRAEVTLTFREGLTMDRILDILAENKVAGRAELEEAAATINWRYEYLKYLPAVPVRLEGYLFPETYTFYINESPVSALQKFVREFDMRLTAEMRERIEKSGFTLHEILTIASLIEAEATADEDERKNVASVIYNRLKQDMRLDIDATVHYLLPEHKERLTAEDLDINSPYNTRKFTGLPPGPICSPSIGSIRAALYPHETRHLYYALHKDNTHHFFNDLASFNAFLESDDFVYND